VRGDATQDVINVGKALAMRYLVDVVNEAMPDADCYVFMDDDIIVDTDHLAALVATARRPGMGMIAPRFHPFNTAVPPGGTVTCLDPCPTCSGPSDQPAVAGCRTCGGLGRDPSGLRLRLYPKEDRTIHKKGKVAGGLFALSKAAIRTLPWAPHPYPILTHPDERPVVYWTEDATLDHSLTAAGLINGYLEGAEYTPVIHLPELNQAYVQWKLGARDNPHMPEFDGHA
jgi:hypothetical protein